MRHQLRHISSVGGDRSEAVNVWCVDANDGAILASIRVASARLLRHLVIRVARASTKVTGERSFAIVRLDTSTWAVENGVFHPDLPAMGLLLTHATDADSAVLSKLSRR